MVKKDDKHYYIYSQNTIAKIDLEKIEPKLIDIQSLSKDEIKKKYRELRRQKPALDSKGAGIGFYEIAKRCTNINYKFTQLSQNNYNFYFEAIIENKKIS